MPLVYKTTILKRLRSSDQPYPLVLIKHPLTHHLLQKFCHCTLSKSAKSKMSQMGSHQVLASMHVFNYNATFSPIHLVFLELDIYQPRLDFKMLGENNSEVILRTFCLQLLSKQ